MVKKDKNKNSKITQVFGLLLVIISAYYIISTNWSALSISALFPYILLELSMSFVLLIVGLMMVFKKTVPMWLRYLAVATTTFWLMSFNSPSLVAYTYRECQETFISHCPDVSNEIKLIFLVKLAIFVVGLVVAGCIYRHSKDKK